MTQSERLAALEQRISDHEARCEERLGEIKRAVASSVQAIESLKGRAWTLAAALLAWALAQLWSANASRLDHVEAAGPAAVRHVDPVAPLTAPSTPIAG